MLYLPEGAWLRLVIWMGIGLIVYFSYGRRHSALRQQMGNAKKKVTALSRQALAIHRFLVFEIRHLGLIQWRIYTRKSKGREGVVSSANIH